ncbi:Biphenyl dioxygenase subunit alpha [Planctomycetes bacterium Pla163]|uniref:Biphenyl dioxygenase subunit alpha n=1 Tax=Rohdeia mirabilis TaxID=2528008 RepID=A0A518CY85_9BACT|nr:Biphenyl dioxygenase subunit alpha [Planctomycetes bacterium Pla163]
MEEPRSWRPSGDIASGALPPPRWYSDPVLYERALERVFAPSWQWLGDEHLAARDGDAVPLTLLAGALDEPLVLTNEGGERRLLSNVCTHRAMAVVTEPCTARGLRCPYHGRRFGLDGRFVSSPGFEGAEGFPTADDDLPRAGLGTFAGQLFGSIAPERPFDDVIAPLRARLGHLPFERAVHDPTRDREFEFDAPWSAYVENYLDGLHIPYLHAGLNAAIDWSRYRYELFEGGAWQVAEARAGDASLPVPAGHPDAGRPIAAWYAMLFPNLMVNVYPWGVSFNLVRPLGPTRTTVRFASYVFAPEHLGAGAGGDLDRVELEDEAAVVRVAQGQRARLARQGRYAPRHEHALRHFHVWTTDRVAERSV